MGIKHLILLTIIVTIILFAAPAETAVIYVKWDSPNDELGNDWDHAYHTVTAGLSAAFSGDQVWVAKGVYAERITLKLGVMLYGGFAGNESSPSARPAFPRPDSDPNATVLDGSGGGRVVVSPSNAASDTVIDGFTIRNGSSSYGAGVFCNPRSSPIISNNTIKGNNSTSQGGGIYCDSGSAARIILNLIKDNNASNGGGIACLKASIVVSGNIIEGNDASSNGGGIYCKDASTPAPDLSNNTIVGNTAGGGGGIYSTSTYSVISNNVVAFNSSGIHKVGSTPVLHNNCVYNPDGQDYTGILPGAGDISEDPAFVDQEAGDYHVSSDSSCIDTGWNDAAELQVDIDGQDRIFNTTVDIGADECYPQESVSISIAKTIADGSVICIDNAAVTAAFTDFFYIEADDRSSGIRIDSAGHTIVFGNKVRVAGTVTNIADCERSIAANIVEIVGSQTIDAIAISNRDLGGGAFGLQAGVKDGFGMNNIGLFIKTWGEVTYAESGFFYLDDGSSLNDGSGHIGVKVYGDVPVGEGENPIGKFVCVTGISSCEKPGADIIRIIRTFGVGDVTVID